MAQCGRGSVVGCAWVGRSPTLDTGRGPRPRDQKAHGRTMKDHALPARRATWRKPPVEVSRSMCDMICDHPVPSESPPGLLVRSSLVAQHPVLSDSPLSTVSKTGTLRSSSSALRSSSVALLSQCLSCCPVPLAPITKLPCGLGQHVHPQHRATVRATVF